MVAAMLMIASQTTSQPTALINLLETPKITQGTNAVTYTLSTKNLGMEWNSLVLSWNIDLQPNQYVKFLVTPPNEEPFNLGIWSNLPGTPSTSINDQKRNGYRVDTDTFSSENPLTEVKITVQWSGPKPPEFKLFSATLANKQASKSPVQKLAPIPPLEVPTRAQMSYPGGAVLCSPTCTSMVLAYWAKVLDRPFLDSDVPDVQKGCYDPAWKGTGNWSFNVAFAGSKPGIRAYVARLWNVEQIAEWLKAKVPVVCSVSRAMLSGKPNKEPNDGHLVIVVGIDENGDLIFNDPGKNQVRVTFKREDFEHAWATSSRTTYLIYPKTWITPENSDKVWL
jgi:hypothetical protein